MNISEKLIRLRKEKGYSQEELAEKLNVSRQAVSRWEMGSALPDTINIIAITKLYGVSADYLLNDEYETEEDMPLVKNARDKGARSSYMQTIYILSLAMNIISLLIGWVGFYFSKNAGITLIGIVISIMSIAGFETSLVKYSESDKNSYRIKFYDISVWIVGFVPVCIICEYMPVLSELLETAFGTFIGRSAGFAITYFVICLAVREIVGKKIQ